MDSLREIAPDLWGTNNEAEIYFYIRDYLMATHARPINENELHVEGIFRNEDFELVVYDGSERKNSMFYRFEDFCNNDFNFLLIDEIYSVFLNDDPTIKAISKARNKLRDIMSMIPTFKGYFDKKQ